MGKLGHVVRIHVCRLAIYMSKPVGPRFRQMERKIQEW